MTGLNEEDLKKNVRDKDTWMRFVYLVMFGLIFYVLVGVTFVVSILQFFAKLLSGSTFTGLVEMGEVVAAYLGQVTRYVTFASDDKPFPFAPLPPKPQAPVQIL